nr:MAG TPA: hypothetical protein [Caudoviricetes sp.]
MCVPPDDAHAPYPTLAISEVLTSEALCPLPFLNCSICSRSRPNSSACSRIMASFSAMVFSSRSRINGGMSCPSV